MRPWLRTATEAEPGVYLEMVDVALRPHHQFAGRDGLTTSAAGAAVPK